jgi:AraC-like DNA-binding protein
LRERKRQRPKGQKLESTNRNRTIQASGFGNEDRMRRVFHRSLGVGPADYRARFSLRGRSPAKPTEGEANLCN